MSALHLSNCVKYLIIVLIIHHNVCNNLLFPIYSGKHLLTSNTMPGYTDKHHLTLKQLHNSIVTQTETRQWRREMHGFRTPDYLNMHNIWKAIAYSYALSSDSHLRIICSLNYSLVLQSQFLIIILKQSNLVIFKLLGGVLIPLILKLCKILRNTQPLKIHPYVQKSYWVANFKMLYLRDVLSSTFS